jgi:hypothetical protein
MYRAKLARQPVAAAGNASATWPIAIALGTG